MTILVTGANGFIGSHVVRSLLKRGYPVRVFVRNNADMRNLSWLNMEIVRGDLLKANTIVNAVTGCRAIIHTAGLINTIPSTAGAFGKSTLSAQPTCSLPRKRQAWKKSSTQRPSLRSASA